MSELTAHHLAGAWGLPSVSPFCLKLDAYLRMTGIPHKAVTAPTPFAGPKGKAPWIEHDGKKIGDSGFIVDYLKARFNVDPDASLTPAQRGTAVALRRLIEENLYWVMVYDRWIVDENWKLFREVELAGVPVPARYVIAPFARRRVRNQLNFHGLGLHTRDEIHAIGKRDIAAISDILGDKPFIFGDQPTEIDAIAYAQLANIMQTPIATPVKDDALGRKNLVAYLDRFKQRYY